MAGGEMGASARRTPEEWGAQYAARRGLYQDYTQRLHTLVLDVLRGAHIDVIQVEARAKEVSSFIDKVRRKEEKYEDPFASMTDLVGLRVITYYLDDVMSVGELLRRELRIDDGNSDDKASLLASDQFGYRSSHYVGTLSSPRVDLPEWQPFKDLIVEVQVRTALQHAWAAVNHKLQYKGSDEAPIALGRRFNRLSALFELADEQFAVLRDESRAADVANRDEVGGGRLDAPIDASSLRAFWDVSQRVKAVERVLRDAGFKVAPADEERMETDRSDLIKALRRYGFVTLSDLDGFLADEPRLTQLARALVKVIPQKDRGGSAEDFVTQLLIIDRDVSEYPGRPYYAQSMVQPFIKARDAVAL